jgi:hypothetical protein
MNPEQKRILIVGTVTAVILVISLVTSILVRRRRRRMMTLLATEFGMKVVVGKATFPKVGILFWIRNPDLVVGKVGTHLTVFQHTHRGRNTYHGFSMALNRDPGLTIMIMPNTIFGKLTILPGLKQAKTGDALFDSTIAIRSSDPTLTSAIFSTPELKSTLLDVWKREKPSSRIEIVSGTIRYVRSDGMGNERRVRHMSAMIRAAATLADALDAVADVTSGPRARSK